MRNQNVAESVVALLRAMEEGLLTPAVRRDRSQVGELLATDFMEFGSSGRVWNREQILALLASETPSKIVMSEFKCREIAEGVVLATNRAERIDPGSGEHTSSLRSSLWVNEDGEWRLHFHQGTRIAP
jgi:hypothetical protein